MPKKKTDKIIYEENPWEDVKNHKDSDFKVVNDLLPPPSELKNARIVVDDGVPCPDLAAYILHEFVKNSSTNTSRL